LDRLPFQSLLAALFPVLNDAEILQLVAHVTQREVFAMDSMVLKTRWSSLTELLIFNALHANRYRAYSLASFYLFIG
jgi:hypothetical protein